MSVWTQPIPLPPWVLPRPTAKSGGWHVSPAVDLAAYSFSWLWILVPLALSGEHHYTDYLLLWSVGITLSFAHRHFTMPYVYLDPQVFAKHPTRFTLFPALLMLGFVASAFLSAWKSPAGFFGAADAALAAAGVVLVVSCVLLERRGHALQRAPTAAVVAAFLLMLIAGLSGAFVAFHAASLVLSAVCVAAAAAVVARGRGAFAWRLFALCAACAVAVCGVLAVERAEPDTAWRLAGQTRGNTFVGVFAVVAAVWNVWHTLMQKFGILRLYAAKSPAPVEQRTPAWVDRLLVFSWFPTLALYVGPSQREIIFKQGKIVRAYTEPTIEALDAVAPVLLPLSFVLVAAALFFFVRSELRSGVISWPRISMAAGLTLLNASFFVLSPLKVYIAYGFSHAVEYVVFVWAFQRRRYAEPLAHRPLLQRVLKHPVLAYGGFMLVVGGLYFGIELGDDWGLHEGGLRFFGVKWSMWLFTFAIWHSFAHFYFDGFLWKMRLPLVRAHL